MSCSFGPSRFKTRPWRKPCEFGARVRVQKAEHGARVQSPRAVLQRHWGASASEQQRNRQPGARARNPRPGFIGPSRTPPRGSKTDPSVLGVGSTARLAQARPWTTCSRSVALQGVMRIRHKVQTFRGLLSHCFHHPKSSKARYGRAWAPSLASLCRMQLQFPHLQNGDNGTCFREL